MWPCSALTILDLPFWPRERAPYFAEFVPEFVQQKRHTGDRRAGNREVRSSDRNPLALRILNVVVGRDDRANEGLQRRWLGALRIVSGAERTR